MVYSQDASGGTRAGAGPAPCLHTGRGLNVSRLLFEGDLEGLHLACHDVDVGHILGDITGL